MGTGFIEGMLEPHIKAEAGASQFDVRLKLKHFIKI